MSTNGTAMWPSMQGGQAGQRAAFLRLLDRCQARLAADLDPLLSATFRRLDDALYDLADKADGDRLHAVWYEALALLRRERDSLRRRFLRNLGARATRFQAIRVTLERAAPMPRFDAADLTLLGHEDLEESLMVGNLVSKADSRYRVPLQALTDQFRRLIGHEALRVEHLPTSPAVICESFRAAVRSLPGLPLSAALVAYKVFDSQVMDRLGPTYAACQAFALAAGPAPAAGRTGPAKMGTRPDLSLRAPAAASPPAAAVPPPAPSAARPGPGTGAAAGPAMPAATLSFDTLSVLLAGQRRALMEDPAMPLVARDELLAELSRLQHAATAADDPAQVAPVVLREALFGGLRVAPRMGRPGSGAPVRRLERKDADSMDLMFLLFEQLLAAPDIPEPLKLLVSRLQIPYVKLALTDQGVFDDPAHPARRLLNRIAATAIGWSDPADRAADPVYSVLREVVERVVTELHDTPGLFAELDALLAGRLGDGAGVPLPAEARILAAATARVRRSRARRRVLAAVAARRQRAGAVPPAVLTIINDGWAEVLLQIAAEQGEQSAAWADALQVLDLLLWSVAPKPDPADRRELLRRIPELLRQLRAGLVSALTDAHLVARWLQELQTLHIAVLRGAVAGDDDPAPAQTDADPPTPDPALLADLDALPLGSWLALSRDDGAWLRVRLAWRSADGDDLILVDRQGRRPFELTRQDLALMLDNDLAQVIGDGREPLVDRALAEVRRGLSAS